MSFAQFTRSSFQVVTGLKNTAKLVTELPFPALTFCSSGLHVNNMEQKLIRDFANWRRQEKRNETNKEAIYKDTMEFMQNRFQIKPRGTTNESPRERSINILDILDTMIAPDADASVAANSVRHNLIACQQLWQENEDNLDCPYSCSANFNRSGTNISGSKCFYVSPGTANYTNAVTACRDLSAEVASISNSAEEDRVWKLMNERGNDTYIGLVRKESFTAPGQGWVWQDGSPYVFIRSRRNTGNFSNWSLRRREPKNKEPTGFGERDCATKTGPNSWHGGKWAASKCDKENNYACSMSAQKSWKILAMEDLLRRGHEKKNSARHFFANSDIDMRTLYPEVFRLLSQTTLPCFKEEDEEEHMMLSCELAGVRVNCSNLFTRVPTDSGMCCALNSDNTLKASEYQQLVEELQGNKRTLKVMSQEGSRNGLKLTLDLHSNTVSFGSLDQHYSIANLFIGQPAQFPMMRDKSIRLQPGREHFVELSATVVATDGIKDILPQARGCLFNDDMDLEFYKSYTFSNCRLECRIKEAEEKHKCIPWHLPKVSMAD